MLVTRVLAAGFLCWTTVQRPPMNFTTLDRGDHSQIEEPRNTVARTAEEWTALWKAHGGKGKPPAIDTARSMTIGVFLGTRPTAGYTVEITRIEKRGADLLVTYREQGPSAGEMVAQVLTSPFHIVRTELHGGRVRFQAAR